METTIAAPVANLTDLLLDAVCMVDAGGQFRFVSMACERIFGYTQQEMIGKQMIDLVTPADRARTLAAAQNVMNGQSHINFENRYIRKDGSIVHIMWSARWSEADQLRVAVARDITALKHAEAMQAALYAISEAAQASDDLTNLFRRSHEIIGQLLPAPGFFVALPEGPDRQLQFAYRTGADFPGDQQMRLLCEEVFHSNAPLALDAGMEASLPAPLQALARAMPDSALAVPLTVADGTVGVLALRTGTGDVHYGAKDRELLIFVSNQLANAIQRKQLHAQLHFMALHDELTRLPNRHLFLDRFGTALARARRHGCQLALLFIDLNRFKQVNDKYGHVYGDRLLLQVATRIQTVVRDSDTLARLGGDEFVILLEDNVLPHDTDTVIDKIHCALADPFTLSGEVVVHISASIGIAHYPAQGKDIHELISQADASMYAAKNRG